MCCGLVERNAPLATIVEKGEGLIPLFTEVHRKIERLSPGVSLALGVPLDEKSGLATAQCLIHALENRNLGPLDIDLDELRRGQVELVDATKGNPVRLAGARERVLKKTVRIMRAGDVELGKSRLGTRCLLDDREVL